MTDDFLVRLGVLLAGVALMTGVVMGVVTGTPLAGLLFGIASAIGAVCIVAGVGWVNHA